MKKIAMSGVIGWDVMPSQIREELEKAGGEDINLLISSPGGLVSDALEIFNMVRNYDGNVTATLSGFAMSAASYIPLAADRVVAEDNAVYMIHNVHGGVWGDHNDILHYGEMCKGLSGMMTKAYSRFTGKTVDELAEMMDAETFFYGDQIVENGFAHEVIEGDNDQDEDGAKASAMLVFKEMSAKLSADQEAVKQDLSRAVAFGEINRAMKPTTQDGEPNMDLKQLKEKYPDLVALIVSEATGDVDTRLDEARAQGATDECARIQSVHSQMFPGHETVVESAMFDGKSNAGDVAMLINAANIEAHKVAQRDLTDDAPAPVDEQLVDVAPVAPTGSMTEETARAAWDKSQDLQDEFLEFENYFAFVKDVPNVNVKTVQKRGE